MPGPWNEYPRIILEPRIQYIESEPSSLGTRMQAVVIYDASEFPEGNDPAASSWGKALDLHLYGSGDDEDDEDHEYGYPAGWLAYNFTRIAGEIYAPDFRHPIFPLHLVGSTGSFEPIARARVEGGPQFLEQWFMVDMGTPTLYLCFQRDPGDPAVLRVRGADHSHREGHEHPQSWETMDRAWGNRRFELRIPWEPFWSAYEAFWRDRAKSRAPAAR